jgi:hypothetical protein
LLQQQQQQARGLTIQGIHVSLDNISRTDGNYQFPVICPSDHELYQLLNQSLLLEQIIVPEFYQHEKEHHISDFWYHAHIKQEYCTIDIPTILRQQRHWIYFFQHVVPTYLDQTPRPKKRRTNR